MEELQQFAAVFGMVKSTISSRSTKRNSSPMRSRAWSPASTHIRSISKEVVQGIPRGHPGRLSASASRSRYRRIGQGSVPADRGVTAYRAGLEAGRPDRSPDRRQSPVKGLTMDDAGQAACVASPTPRAAHHLPQGRELQLPGHHHARGNQAQSVREDGRARLRLGARRQFQSRSRSTTSPASSSELYKADLNIKGLVLTCATTRRSARRVAVGSVFPPADVVVVSTNGQIAESRVHLQRDITAQAVMIPIRRLHERRPPGCAQAAAGRAGQRWARHGHKRDRRWRSCRTHKRALNKGKIRPSARAWWEFVWSRWSSDDSWCSICPTSDRRSPLKIYTTKKFQDL